MLYYLKLCPIFVGPILCQFKKDSNFLEVHSFFDKIKRNRNSMTQLTVIRLCPHLFFCKLLSLVANKQAQISTTTVINILGLLKPNNCRKGFFFLLQLFARGVLVMKKLEIEKTKPTFIISTFKTDIIKLVL